MVERGCCYLRLDCFYFWSAATFFYLFSPVFWIAFVFFTLLRGFGASSCFVPFFFLASTTFDSFNDLFFFRSTEGLSGNFVCYFLTTIFFLLITSFFNVFLSFFFLETMANLYFFLIPCDLLSIFDVLKVLVLLLEDVESEYGFLPFSQASWTMTYLTCS